MRRWKTLVVPLAVALATAAAAPALADPAPAPPPQIKVENGETQPVFSRADAIIETVFVEVAGVDSDNDGKPDRVAADIMRPKETDAGLKVPVIMEASPYYAPLNDVPMHDVDIDGDDPGQAKTRAAHNRLAELQAAGAVSAGPFDGYYDNFFVPRGYAVALVESLGSARATGCPTSGGRNETLGVKAAVDWLNGRARGFDADGNPVTAGWTTGNVGMIGVSYNGTLPNAVATTGVEGLKTIVPIAAISSWYDYYRANGGVLAPGGFQGEDTDVLAKAVLTRENPQICAPVMDALTRDQDRITGDYSRFWAERDYLHDVNKVRASVLLVHGLNDWNVKTMHFGQWWDALAKRGVPRKIWLHQAGHTSPFNLRHTEWMRTLHRWMDHWLHGLQNGIMNEPQADVEYAPNQWAQHKRWPLPGTATVPLRLGAGARLGLLPGGAGPFESFTDQRTRTAETLAANPQTPDPNRLAYVTEPLKKDVRISGKPEITVRASLKDGRSPYLTALLVDYGEDERATGGTRSTGQRVCYGQGVPGDDGCTTLRTHVTATTPFKIVSRGWLDVRNRHSESRTEPVTPGRPYLFRWDFQPQDHIFKAGHRIGVVLLSTDYDYTLRYPPGTQVSVQPGASSLWLPVVFGRDALT
ncbi:Xaa-Pro dipeptidyl-peptidase [Bailinhaonella thermotolerans]|uniref:Xaa-Pro dipeptidyl-peptidase n=1 Tax=Bailinhaonella thermotolerans TaxID=1070861 RepID=A0A3A4ACB7_9ACTN|nr:Xaa-Pro dipeptidyl-peptidase [Bailinhaonella thermotolerans]RJL23670.1 Xaa-Pro dipeptidyl-peptidase [Bailinhaonella thermotolerans]